MNERAEKIILNSQPADRKIISRRIFSLGHPNEMTGQTDIISEADSDAENEKSQLRSRKVTGQLLEMDSTSNSRSVAITSNHDRYRARRKVPRGSSKTIREPEPAPDCSRVSEKDEGIEEEVKAELIAKFMSQGRLAEESRRYVGQTNALNLDSTNTNSHLLSPKPMFVAQAEIAALKKEEDSAIMKMKEVLLNRQSRFQKTDGQPTTYAPNYHYLSDKRKDEFSRQTLQNGKLQSMGSSWSLSRSPYVDGVLEEQTKKVLDNAYESPTKKIQVTPQKARKFQTNLLRKTKKMLKEQKKAGFQDIRTTLLIDSMRHKLPQVVTLGQSSRRRLESQRKLLSRLSSQRQTGSEKVSLNATYEGNILRQVMTPTIQQQQNIGNDKTLNSSLQDSGFSSSDLSETIDANSAMAGVPGRFGSSQFLKRAQSLSPNKRERKVPGRSNFSTKQLGTSFQFNVKIPRKKNFSDKSLIGLTPVQKHSSKALSSHASQMASRMSVLRKTSLRQCNFLETSSCNSRKSMQYKQINQYRLQSHLGDGACGSVYSCIHVQTKQQYAIKCIKREKLRMQGGYIGAKQSKDVKAKELDILKTLAHKHIVKLHEIIDDPASKKIYIVMDYLSGGTLQNKIMKEDKGLSDEDARIYFAQLISALHYCHEVKNIAHRDVKPDNLMIDKSGRLILCDFGVSQFFASDNDMLQGTQGTVRFQAPELLGISKQESGFSGRAIDVWAAGVTLYFMMTKKFPFNGTKREVIQEQVKENKPDLSMIENDQIKDLIREILVSDPTQRITTAEILENDWLTKGGEEPVDLDLSQEDAISYGSALESVDSVSQESDSSSEKKSSDISDLAAQLDEMVAMEKKTTQPVRPRIIPSGKNVFGL